jgi:hypothetical protein
VTGPIARHEARHRPIDTLGSYVLLSPFIVFGVTLFVVWLTGWMDRRDARRHPAE